jgi:hypothetical protein
MITNKKEIDSLQTINVTFINSLSTIIVPFVKKLEIIHRNKVDLNDGELEKLKQAINVIKIYSSKEASFSKYLSTRTEQDIINDINYELAIVMRIAVDAEKGKLEQLYSDCGELKLRLLKLETDIVNFKKTTA